MNLSRTFKSYFQILIRERILYVAVLATVFLTIILLRTEIIGKHFQLYCASKIHQHQSYKKLGINVVPSLPQALQLNSETRKYEANYSQIVIAPSKNECLKVKFPDGSESYIICIRDPYMDVIVSGHLKGEGQWERENIEYLVEAHRMFPDMILVDLGCNIGIFTLPAAKLGMEVVAVDIMLDSLKLVQRSLLINDLHCQVTLVHNAIHRRRSKMHVQVNTSNIAAARVKELHRENTKDVTKRQLVDAICLDDLVPLVRGKTVLLKIDIEGSEEFCLQCAKQFFKQNNVKILLLKWVYLRNSHKESMQVIEFLTSQNMVPTWGLDVDRMMDKFAAQSWPDHVYWIKQK